MHGDVAVDRDGAVEGHLIAGPLDAATLPAFRLRLLELANPGQALLVTVAALGLHRHLPVLARS